MKSLLLLIGTLVLLGLVAAVCWVKSPTNQALQAQMRQTNTEPYALMMALEQQKLKEYHLVKH